MEIALGNFDTARQQGHANFGSISTCSPPITNTDGFTICSGALAAAVTKSATTKGHGGVQITVFDTKICQ